MIFTSYTYVLFLGLAFILHWSLPGKYRKVFLVVASYVFYASWQWEFLFLLLGVSLFNWAYGLSLSRRKDMAGWLVIGIAVNLVPLVIFKYTGFLAENAFVVTGWMGFPCDLPRFNLILPLGISFFTFQGIAYLVDVATGEPPIPKLIDFLLFKALWPQLIAGPIVRLGEIRGQIEGDRSLGYEDYSAGCRRILFGFFKKVVLADNLAPVVEMVFMPTAAPNIVDSLAGVFGFGLQIYFDFSAYSDIAIGSARLFGFRLPENFDWPYLAASPQEFWNRWHMTLSRWIRDYLFTPMAFASRRRPGVNDRVIMRHLWSGIVHHSWSGYTAPPMCGL